MVAAPLFHSDCTSQNRHVIGITSARDHGHSVITDTRAKLCNDGGCVLRAILNYPAVYL
jgi:hypothetical protein